MFENKELLNEIFSQENKENQKEYIIFTHSDKTWVMPKDSLKTAFDMYQPSTFKGKLLKKLILFLKPNTKILCKLECKTARLQINDKVKTYIEKVAAKKDISIAVYMGDTTSKQNNKATLQVYDKNRLICYVKVTEDKEVAKTFNHEIEELKFLEDKGINNIPKVMGVCVIDGMNIFVQSTKKPPYQKVKLKFGSRQIDFIDGIIQATKVKLPYENTDFYLAVKYLKSKSDDFSSEEKSTLMQSIEIIEEKLAEKPQEYAFSHGDYTPWNIYYNSGELNAFDFEYCSHTMPCHIDIFHYLTQMCFLGFQEEVGKTIHIYKNNRKLLKQYICDPDFTYLCYLVYIVSFYKKRTEKESETVNEKYSKWIGIIEYLNGNINNN